MNMTVFRFINNLAMKNMILDNIMIIFSKYVPFLFIAISVVVFILGIKEKHLNYRQVVFSTLFIAVVNLILSFIIGGLYYVDRPFVHHKVNLLINHTKDASFPSDHAIGTMSIALGLQKYNKAVGITLTILSLIVGISRVYVGNHYPMDVIGAYIIAIITTYIYNVILRSKMEKIYEIVEKKIFLTLGFKKLYKEVEL